MRGAAVWDEAMSGPDYLMRWKGDGDGFLSFEVRPRECPIWFYVGSVRYFPANWLHRLLHPKRWYAAANGVVEKFRTLDEAREYVELNGSWG